MKAIYLFLAGAAWLLILSGQGASTQARSGISGPPTSAIQGTPLGGPASLRLPDGHLATVPGFKSDVDMAPSMAAVGSPAIRPTSSGGGPDMPAFTVADVQRYAQDHNTRGVGAYSSRTPVTVVRIEFLTESALRARIPGARAVPSTTLVCYVQYGGDFLYYRGAPGSQTAAQSPRSAEVFDARSGNLLMEGVGPWIK
jgi:hypothetical protein